MKSIILSIHSKHAEKIYSGEKVWEFRKTVPKGEDPWMCWFYEAKPKGLITGVCLIDDLWLADPEWLWEECQDGAGITKEEFFKYFKGHKMGYAWDVEKATTISTPLPISNFNLTKAPQSWCYTK